MTGFFSQSQLQQAGGNQEIRLPRCGRCGLHTSCTSPKMPITGKGKQGVLVVAEAPGSEEDKRNEQLVGPSGKYLRDCLETFGVDLDRDCWKTNALICKPPGKDKPTQEQIVACRSNLIRTIKETEPRMVLLLGGFAVDSVIGWLWKGSTGAVSRWVGWHIPSQQLNAWVCPTFHPSYLLHMKDDIKKAPTLKVARLWWERHLESAFSLEGRPWKEVPDYRKQVEVIRSVDVAAGRIKEFVDDGSPTAFDYETNMKKPDSEEAEIVCASMSNGKWTIAFPMHGPAEEAFGKFIQSPVPKVAQNLKFEDRWSRAVLKKKVRNWKWDTMQAAHVLDNRSGVTGLKFQAFVRLGVPAYDNSIAPYLDCQGGNEKNRVRQADMRDLLLYCGIDSLVTIEIAKLQKAEIG